MFFFWFNAILAVFNGMYSSLCFDESSLCFKGNVQCNAPDYAILKTTEKTRIKIG